MPPGTTCSSPSHPNIEYIKGYANDSYDAFIRIRLINYDMTENNNTRETLDEIYCVDKLDGDMFPLTNQTIDKYQWKYKELLDKLKHANYHTKFFRGGGKVMQLICRNDKIVVPKMIKWNKLVPYIPTVPRNGSY